MARHEDTFDGRDLSAEAGELIEFLERDQLSSDRLRPLPRATVGRRAQVALWVLRVFALVVGLLVIYTFAAALHG